MTDAEVYSWILLSISYGGGTRTEIAQVADGINHAVPTEKEMDASLLWLQEKRLVCIKDSRFKLTETGAAIFSKIPSSTMLKTWSAVAKTLENL